MNCLYEHLPEKVKAYRFDGGSFVNAKECPQNEKRICRERGPCCLGTSRNCEQNNCPNNQK